MALATDLMRRFPALQRLLDRPRLHFIQQTTTADCGAACLSMVLTYHGKELPLEQIREVMNVDLHGVNAFQILQAGRCFGLRARGFRVDSPEDLLHLPAATVLHWDFHHFVVLESVSGNHITILDPANGRVQLSRAEFAQHFTGIALAFEPGDSFEPQVVRQVGLRRYLQYLWTERTVLRRVLFASLMLQVLAMLLPGLSGVVIDRVVARQDYDLLWLLVVAVIVLGAFRFVSHLLRAHLLLHLRSQLDARLTLDFIERLVSLPYSFFERRSSGDLITRLNSNTEIREILTAGALSTLLDGVLVTLNLLLLLFVSPLLSLLVLLLGGIRVAVFLLTKARQRELASEILQAQTFSNGFKLQLLASMESLKSSGQELRAVERWSHTFVDELNANIKQGRLQAMTDSLMDCLNLISPLLILMAGAALVMSGTLSLGTMLAVQALALGFLTPVGNLVQTGYQMQRLRSYLERVNDVMEAAPEQEVTAGHAVTEQFRGEISLRDVSFRYGPLSPLVLEHINLDVKLGEFVAIVGRSGSGKSTLARLLIGLHLPDSGQVLIDGVAISQWNLRTLRQHFGVVPQQVQLFAASLRENISCFDTSMPLREIERAARLAHIHDDIIAMPLGYNTQLADRGGGLSGGQRQRVALAHALVHQPRILFLDEATSALDALTEAKVQHSLESLQMTRIVIAHRLSTVRQADRIVVLDAGRIVDCGQHEALLQRCALYQQLVQAQLNEAAAAVA